MRQFLMLVLFSFPYLAFSSEDDWLGSESAGGHVGVRYGVFKDDSNSKSVNITIPFFYMGQLHGFYSDSRSSNSDTTSESQQLGAFLNSDPFKKYSWGLGYENSGRSSDLKTKDISVYLQYTTDNLWVFELKLLMVKQP